MKPDAGRRLVLLLPAGIRRLRRQGGNFGTSLCSLSGSSDFLPRSSRLCFSSFPSEKKKEERDAQIRSACVCSCGARAFSPETRDRRELDSLRERATGKVRRGEKTGPRRAGDDRFTVEFFQREPVLRKHCARADAVIFGNDSCRPGGAHANPDGPMACALGPIG